LLAGDLAGQMGLGFGQPMRPTRNAPDDRLSSLGAFQSRRRIRLSLLFGLVRGDFTG
jgi:hypothetical protein